MNPFRQHHRRPYDPPAITAARQLSKWVDDRGYDCRYETGVNGAVFRSTLTRVGPGGLTVKEYRLTDAMGRALTRSAK